MILASKSPRRKEILENIGFNLVIKSEDIEEVSDKIEVVESKDYERIYSKRFQKGTTSLVSGLR